MHIVVLMPVLNDWESAREVIGRLDTVFAARTGDLSALLVDDGSTETPPPDFAAGPFGKITAVSILRLKKNLGHQRAIAAGLCHIADKAPCDVVVVMDADGQDDPEVALRLVEKLEEINRADAARDPVVFAARARRSESPVFRIGYLGYRILHHLLTGRGINFGNFSIIPRSRLGAITADPMLWNHYAASIAGSRLPTASIPTSRNRRIAGSSRLNYVGLVIHGLSAFSCYSEIIGVRLVLFSSLLFILSLLGILLIIALRLFTHLYVPGWTSLFAGILLILLMQVVTLAGNFTMQMISLRGAQPFQPMRDYLWYVDGATCCFSRGLQL